MSMILELRTVAADLAGPLAADTHVVNAVLYGEDGWQDPDDAELFGDVDVESVLDRVVTTVDLDKAWHGVHFLLTGSPWDTGTTLGQAVLGGREVGEDGGYGHPRLHDPEAVVAIATALSAVDHEALARRFDPSALEAADVYPTGIWREDDIVGGYLLPTLAHLTDFYAGAAKDGLAVLIALT